MYPSIIRGKGLGGREGGGQGELKAPYAARSGTAHGATPVGFSALALAARHAGVFCFKTARGESTVETSE